jgi:hypothetical protein
MADEDSVERTWTCLCGKFQAQVTGKPIFAACCYCTMCRKFMGGPFSLGIWTKMDISKGGGQDDIIKYVADEAKGGKNYRCSCSTCGSFCYGINREGNLYFVGLGGLEGGTSAIKPAANIFVAHRGNQEILLPDLPQFEESSVG